MKQDAATKPYRFIASLGFLCGVSICLLLARVASSESERYVFLIWNLILATVPLLLGWWLVLRLQHQRWMAWQQILLTISWLAFLPNSFYLVTDFIHLRETYEISLLFDVVLLTSFTASGLALGFTSVFMVHRELAKRLSEVRAYTLIGLIFLACSFATYLGRFTRWNTWDLVYRPAGLLFDVSDRVVNPAAHGETYAATLIFFLLITSIYAVIWEAYLLVRRK